MPADDSERDRDHAVVAWILPALDYLRRNPETTEDQFAANWPELVGVHADAWWGRTLRETAMKVSRDVYHIWKALR